MPANNSPRGNCKTITPYARILNRDFVKALHSAEVKEQLRQQALDIGGNSQADFQKFWVEQIAGFKTVIGLVRLARK